MTDGILYPYRMTQQVCGVACIPGTVESREACLQMTLVAFDIPPVPLKTRRGEASTFDFMGPFVHLSLFTLMTHEYTSHL